MVIKMILPTRGKVPSVSCLTDMPADPALFDSINASIIKVELLGSENNGHVILKLGRNADI